MDWNELLQWSQKGFIACCALVLQLTLTLVVGVDAASRPVQAQPASPHSDRSSKDQLQRELQNPRVTHTVGVKKALR
jgi:hypothetical protein